MKYKGMVDVLTKTLHSDGFKGLYRVSSLVYVYEAQRRCCTVCAVIHSTRRPEFTLDLWCQAKHPLHLAGVTDLRRMCLPEKAKLQ